MKLMWIAYVDVSHIMTVLHAGQSRSSTPDSVNLLLMESYESTTLKATESRRGLSTLANAHAEQKKKQKKT